MIIYTLIFALFVALSFIYTGGKPDKITITAMAVFFIIFVGFRSPYIDQDYQNYLYAAYQGWGIAEISYFWIADLSYALTGDYTLVFVIYAAIGLTTVIFALERYSNHFWVSMAFFFSTYFVMLHMNAIRMGAGMGIAMLAWQPWQEGKHLKAIGLILLATLFHYSFAVLLPVYLIVHNNDRFINWFMLLVPVAYLFHFYSNLQGFFALINLTFVEVKTGMYNAIETATLSVFSGIILLRVIIIGVIYLYRERLAELNDKFYMLFKIYILGVTMVVAIADMPTVALRTLDIFACSELILLPLFCDLFRPKWVGIASVCAYAAFYFILYYIAGDNIKPYELNI